MPSAAAAAAAVWKRRILSAVGSVSNSRGGDFINSALRSSGLTVLPQAYSAAAPAKIVIKGENAASLRRWCAIMLRRVAGGARNVARGHGKKEKHKDDGNLALEMIEQDKKSKLLRYQSKRS